MNSGKVICVDGGYVEVLSDEGGEVVDSEANTKSFSFTGSPILLMFIQLGREVATQ